MPFTPRTPRIYSNFEDIRKEIENDSIKVLFKYRDWRDDYHKNILLENEIWLANPNEFNDVFDVHIPLKFDYSEIEDPRFLEKIKFHLSLRIGFDVNSRDCCIRSENLLDQIRLDPKWFEKNSHALREDPEYNSIGIFSTSRTCLENTMWGHYANSHKGFCIGLKYPGLVQTLNALAQPVHYVEENLKFSLLNDNPFMNSLLFIKQDKWESEAEYRFATLGIKSDSQRLIKFNPSIVNNVIFGYKMPQHFQDEIITILRVKYSSKPLLYKTKVDPTSYNLSLDKISY
jgi:Protein of unknown function (DUF2971)